MADTLKKLRIFAASPSDVATERAKLETVVASLKPTADYLGLTLEVEDWRAVVPDAGRPQQIIFDQLKPTSWDRRFCRIQTHSGLRSISYPTGSGGTAQALPPPIITSCLSGTNLKNGLSCTSADTVFAV